MLQVDRPKVPGGLEKVGEVTGQDRPQHERVRVPLWMDVFLPVEVGEWVRRRRERGRDEGHRRGVEQLGTKLFCFLIYFRNKSRYDLS